MKSLRYPPGGDRAELDWPDKCPRRLERDLEAGGKGEPRRNSVWGHPHSIGSLGCLPMVFAGSRHGFSFSQEQREAQTLGFSPTATSQGRTPPIVLPFTAYVLDLTIFASLASLLADTSGLPGVLSLP